MTEAQQRVVNLALMFPSLARPPARCTCQWTRVSIRSGAIAYIDPDCPAGRHRQTWVADEH